MIGAGLAAGSRINHLNVTTVIASVGDRLMGTMVELGINEEGARIFGRGRIDGVCPDRSVNCAAFRPGMKPTVNGRNFIKIVG